MKRIPFIISIITLSFTFVACGDNVSATTTPEQEEVVTENITTEYNGEGAGQGVIKSDDELEALEEEASEYSSGEDYDTYVIESKEEVEEATTTEYEKPWYGPLGTSDYKSDNYPYVPIDDYWISNNQFDLVGWVHANGGSLGYYAEDGSKQKKENDETMMYRCTFNYSVGTWNIYMGSCYGFDISKEGEENSGFSYTSNGNSEIVSINQYGCYTYADVITAIDNTVKQTKENPSGPIIEPPLN